MRTRRLNLVFTISSVTTNVSTLPVGTFFDHYGPRAAALLGCVFLSIGCVFMAFADVPGPVDFLTLGYALLSLGGCFIFVPSFHLSNAFPKASGLILALVTGAFDASAAVPLLYRLVYEATDGEFNLRRFFLAFLAVPAVIFAGQLWFMPAQSYKTVAELDTDIAEALDPLFDVHSSDEELESEAAVRAARQFRREQRWEEMSQITDILGDKSERRERREREAEVKQASGVWGALHGQSAHEQMTSPWFVLITLFTVIQMIRMTFFIATVRGQYEYMLASPEKADAINDFFDLALPIGGIIAIPFIGLALDRLSTPHVLALMVCLTTAVGILGSLPNMWAAYANVVLFCVLRPFYYSAMSDYAAKVFGFATFGRVYGSIICVAGLCSFAQSGLDALTHLVFADDPRPVNVAMTALNLLVGIALVLFVSMRGSAVRAEHAAQEAAGEYMSLLATVEEADDEWEVGQVLAMASNRRYGTMGSLT